MNEIFLSITTINRSNNVSIWCVRLLCWTEILFVDGYTKTAVLEVTILIKQRIDNQQLMNQLLCAWTSNKRNHHSLHCLKTTNKYASSVKIATRTFATHYFKVTYLIYSFLVFIKHSLWVGTDCNHLLHVITSY